MRCKPVTAVVLGSTLAFAQSPSTQPIPIQISKETTHILSPLRSDGMPDYIAAYNEYLPKVPPEQNAFPLVVQATGPLFDANQQRQFIEMLHLAPFPADGPYLEPFFKYWTRLHPHDPENTSKEADGTLDRLQNEIDTGLVSDADRPIIKEWLDAQAVPMALLERASRLKVCAVPLFPKDQNGLMAEASVAIVPFFRTREPFCARASLLASAGNFDGAQNDIVTVLRLARLREQTPMLIGRIEGNATETHACREARNIAINFHATSSQLRALSDALATVPPPETYAAAYDVGERFYALDSFTQLGSGHGLPILRSKLMFWDQAAPVDIHDLIHVDWNVLLGAANVDYDKSAKLFKNADWRTIRKQWRIEMDKNPRPKNIPVFPSFEAFLTSPTDSNIEMKLENQRSEVTAFMQQRPNESDAAFTDRIKLLFDNLPEVEWHSPDLFITCALEYPLTQTTLALEVYRAEHHVYPETLTALVPQYLPALPQDPFADEGPLTYHTTPTGFILYSVGPNGKDDGGRKSASNSEDDIAVTSGLPTPDIPH